MKGKEGFVQRKYLLLFSFILFLFIGIIHNPLKVFLHDMNIQVDGAISVSKPLSKSTYPLPSFADDFTSITNKSKITSINKNENIKVMPGGHSIGIHLETVGVLVVGHHLVNSKDGPISPAMEANIDIGDTILEIEGKKIKNISQVKPFVEQAGKGKKSLRLKVKKESEIHTTTIQPAMDEKNNTYSIGLYIRDTAAGIGTLSFYDPDTKNYGALGHVISDADTKKPIDIKSGKIVHSQVTNIQKGAKNIPGEKRAKFSLSDRSLGDVTKNSPFGIFGTLTQTPMKNYYDQALDIGFSNEVIEGPAKILTVVEGEEIEEYSIEIISNKIQSSPSTKGMVIKITDEKLIEKTGGIVQGMSGSPIIQNNKIIGAITHVFVNDPTSGYGVHIEWMLQDANLIQYNEKLKAS